MAIHKQKGGTFFLKRSIFTLTILVGTQIGGGCAGGGCEPAREPFMCLNADYDEDGVFDAPSEGEWNTCCEEPFSRFAPHYDCCWQNNYNDFRASLGSYRYTPRLRGSFTGKNAAVCTTFNAPCKDSGRGCRQECLNGIYRCEYQPYEDREGGAWIWAGVGPDGEGEKEGCVPSTADERRAYFGTRADTIIEELGLEVCDNYLDDDCDGKVDEEERRAIEVCDGVDNDCDGEIDETKHFNHSACRSSGTYVSTPDTRVDTRFREFSVCRDSYLTCPENLNMPGELPPEPICVGEIINPNMGIDPETGENVPIDICGNDLDDDCDGRIDESRAFVEEQLDPNNCGGCGINCRETLERVHEGPHHVSEFGCGSSDDEPLQEGGDRIPVENLSCKIVACEQDWFDSDGAFENGCECGGEGGDSPYSFERKGSTFTDSNCDQIVEDGEVDRAIFVSTLHGSDEEGTGQADAPFRTINRAIASFLRRPDVPYVLLDHGRYSVLDGIAQLPEENVFQDGDAVPPLRACDMACVDDEGQRLEDHLCVVEEIDGIEENVCKSCWELGRRSPQGVCEEGLAIPNGMSIYGGYHFDPETGFWSRGPVVSEDENHRQLYETIITGNPIVLRYENLEGDPEDDTPMLLDNLIVIATPGGEQRSNSIGVVARNVGQNGRLYITRSSIRASDASHGADGRRGNEGRFRNLLEANGVDGDTWLEIVGAIEKWTLSRIDRMGQDHERPWPLDPENPEQHVSYADGRPVIGGPGSHGASCEGGRFTSRGGNGSPFLDIQTEEFNERIQEQINAADGIFALLEASINGTYFLSQLIARSVERGDSGERIGNQEPALGGQSMMQRFSQPDFDESSYCFARTVDLLVELECAEEHDVEVEQAAYEACIENADLRTAKINIVEEVLNTRQADEVEAGFRAWCVFTNQDNERNGENGADGENGAPGNALAVSAGAMLNGIWNPNLSPVGGNGSPGGGGGGGGLGYGNLSPGWIILGPNIRDRLRPGFPYLNYIALLELYDVSLRGSFLENSPQPWSQVVPGWNAETVYFIHGGGGGGAGGCGGLAATAAEGGFSSIALSISNGLVRIIDTQLYSGRGGNGGFGGVGGVGGVGGLGGESIALQQFKSGGNGGNGGKGGCGAHSHGGAAGSSFPIFLVQQGNLGDPNRQVRSEVFVDRSREEERESLEAMINLSLHEGEAGDFGLDAFSATLDRNNERVEERTRSLFEAQFDDYDESCGVEWVRGSSGNDGWSAKLGCCELDEDGRTCIRDLDNACPVARVFSTFGGIPLR